MVITIKKNSILYFLAIIPFIPLEFVSYYFPLWATICSVARILILAILLYRLIVRKNCVSFPFIFSIIFLGAICVSTLISGGKLSTALYYGIFLIGITLLIEDGIYFNMDALISGLLVWFEILTYLNLIFFLISPSGLGMSVSGNADYFLGNYNTAIKYLLPGITLSIIHAYKSKGRLTLRFLIMFLSIFLFFALLGAVTIIIALLVLAAGLFYYSFRKKWGIFRFEIFIVISIVLTLVFAILGNFGFFSGLIDNILGKDMTLTGRTFIWDRALNYIAQKPIFGYGQASDAVNQSRLGATAAHNIFLDILYLGGLVALILFGFFLVVLCLKLYHNRKKGGITVFAFDIVLCAYCVMWSFNVFGNFVNFYLVYLIFVMAYHCEEFTIYLNKNKNSICTPNRKSVTYFEKQQN